MKVTTIIFGVLLACGVCYATENGPLIMALQPEEQPQEVQLVVPEAHNRQKRGLLLGALGAGAIGAGVIGAGVLGAGALGAGILGAKAVGAGLVGGALASHYARDYGYGHGGHGYDGHGYRGGYGRSYRTHYAPVYVIEESYW